MRSLLCLSYGKTVEKGLKLVSKNENWNWVSDHAWATLGFDWSWCLTCWGQGRQLASFLPASKSPSTSCLERLATVTPSWSRWRLSSSTASSSSARRSSSTPLVRSYFQPSPRSSTSKRISMVSRSSFSVQLGLHWACFGQRTYDIAVSDLAFTIFAQFLLTRDRNLSDWVNYLI